MKLENYLKYLQKFSLVVLNENNQPIHSWKELQDKKLSIEQFTKLFNKNQNSKIALITGYEDMEVIDVDLKVFSTTSEKESFWNEYIAILREAIFDFDNKFAIYKTRNEGYHILYKSKRVQGNRKLAILKDHVEAVIETRGTGGFVYAYPENKIGNLSYFDIKYISDADWRSLMEVSKSYNYEKKIEPPEQKKLVKKYNNKGTTPWDDFNSQNDVWSVVSSDFTVVKDTPKKTFIKRHGSKSFHSGYIYKEDNLMYLFSTGTIYPHETQISPYVAFTYKYHSGNFSESAKDLYSQGFGDRLHSELEEQEIKFKDRFSEDIIKKKEIENIDFPVDVFPTPFRNFILECNDKLDDVIDYSGCSLLWVVSLLLGNRFHVRVKSDWYEVPVVWFSLVGNAGVGKTPSIRRMLKPLIRENNKAIRKYIEKKAEFDEYDKLTQKEKEQRIEVKKPLKEQFIADDITLEALVDLHEERQTGVGVFKDELAGWLKDMNKYRAGSDLEFWLSTWSGSSVNVNRLSRVGSFVESPFIPVIGGIQPNILNELYTQDKKDNGFLDRMLISYPTVSVAHYNEQEISDEALIWYSNMITNLKRALDKFTEFDDYGNVIKHVATFKDDAKTLWVSKFNEITDAQNSDSENEYFKSMYPKQKSYIPRFALILNVLNSVTDYNVNITEIEKKSMEGAIKLSDYFVATAKRMKFENEELDSFKKVSKTGTNNKEKTYQIWESDKDFNRTKVAEMLGVSRRTIINYVKEFENDKSK